MNTLSEFMTSNRSNDWLAFENMRAYVRKGKYLHDGKLINTFDIANVCVHPDFQNQGIFTAFLKDVEALGLPVLIENVLTEQFANFFRKRAGYEVISESYGMVSFLKK